MDTKQTITAKEINNKNTTLNTKYIDKVLNRSTIFALTIVVGLFCILAFSEVYSAQVFLVGITGTLIIGFYFRAYSGANEKLKSISKIINTTVCIIWNVFFGFIGICLIMAGEITVLYSISPFLILGIYMFYQFRKNK